MKMRARTVKQMLEIQQPAQKLGAEKTLDHCEPYTGHLRTSKNMTLLHYLFETLK